jgi:quaternary ammonium compound-resistance protein SugE
LLKYANESLYTYLNYQFKEAKFMEWIYLIIAGFLEVGWALGLKYSKGFTEITPSILTIIGMAASFYFLSLSLKSLPLGNAYAIWTGIGTVGTVVLGIILFKEPINIMRVLCIMFIVLGIVGLKLISAE